MAVYVVGLVGVLVFYLAVLFVGIWAGTKHKNDGEEEIMLAGRSVGVVVGVLTLIATWVGGGFINGTAEAVFTMGLVWCQVPVGYSLSLIIGALLFVKPMREANYVTMLDPFQLKYGNRVGGLLFFPALFGDLFWCAAVLSSLGSSLIVILEVNAAMSIFVSATFAAAYTVCGGMYSVTYTDVLQLLCIVFGLTLSAPFTYNNPAVSQEIVHSSEWIGNIEKSDIGIWTDGILLITLGGIPWQSYFQRVLSIKTTYMAQQTAFWAMIGCFVTGVVAVMFGVIAKATDWSHVEGLNRNITASDGPVILPIVLRFLTPTWVSFFVLGSISAAAMSSADSSILASSTMFARNIYKLTIRPSASEREVLWVMRIAIIVISYLSASIALTVGSIYYLSYLCSDLVYVVLFPQLLLIIFWNRGVNTYGCLTSYAVGLILRFGGGEKGLGLPPLIHYPYYDHLTETQRFPFRTVAMVASLITHIVISLLSQWLFETGRLSADRWDCLTVFPDCHLRRTEHTRELRYKDGIMKGRTNKALHDAVVGKRLSQASDGLLSNDDDSLILKRDRSELTNQASTTSEEPSVKGPRPVATSHGTTHITLQPDYQSAIQL